MCSHCCVSYCRRQRAGHGKRSRRWRRAGRCCMTTTWCRRPASTHSPASWQHLWAAACTTEPEAAGTEHREETQSDSQWSGFFKHTADCWEALQTQWLIHLEGVLLRNCVIQYEVVNRICAVQTIHRTGSLRSVKRTCCVFGAEMLWFPLCYRGEPWMLFHDIKGGEFLCKDSNSFATWSTYVF